MCRYDVSFFFNLVLDTEDDSSLDFIGDGSSSEGRKTPTQTPRKSILKSPKVNEREIFFFLFVFFYSRNLLEKRLSVLYNFLKD